MSAFRQTETLDPRFPVLTRDRMEAILRKCDGDRERAKAAAERWLAEREKGIALAAADPLRHGYRPEAWDLADRACETYGEVLLSGANREGKTEYAARKAVEVLVEGKGRVAAFFHSSEKSSIRQQQPRVHQSLPREWRDIGKRPGDKVTNVKYTVKNGFSDGAFVLPNGSQGFFFNYKQDVEVFEGYEFDVVWMDELAPLSFLEALRFRLGHRRTLVLLTFTPVTGYTRTVAEFMACPGMRVLESKAAQLGDNPRRPEARAADLPGDSVLVKGCPPGHMPKLMASEVTKRAAVFFHLYENPMAPSHEVEAKLEGAPREKVMIRAYGWATKQMAGVFARYGPEHRVSREAFLKLAESGGTRYLSVDPAGTKNWFMKWYLVTPDPERVIVYREWPDFQRYGEWALPGEKIDGPWSRGPAQRADAGAGIKEYKRRILEAEGWVWDDDAGCWDDSGAEPIEVRLIDPRMGGGFITDEEDGTSIMELLAEEQFDDEGRLVGPALLFEEAPASRVEETAQMIAELLEWNPNEKLSVMNCPRWQVVEDCLQSDLAMREWTGAGGEKCALKDIVDCDRYFVKADLGFVGEGQYAPSGGGSY